MQYTERSGDYGVDVIARKGNDAYSIQVKRYSNEVGRAAISDEVARMAYYKCNKAMVITSNYFSPFAKQLAAINHCELVDRYTLSGWIRESTGLR